MRLTAVLQRSLLVAVAAVSITSWSGCLGCGGTEPVDGAGAAPAEIAPQLDTESSASSDLRARFPDHAAHVLTARGAFAAEEDAFLLAPEAVPAPRRGLSVRLPRAGSTPIRFELPSGFVAEVRERGVTGEGVIAGRAVAYARTGGTSYWAATEDGYEEWLMLEPGVARADRDAATWEIAGATPRQAGDAVELADAEGVARVIVRAPAAYAASGRPVGVRLVVEGATIGLRVDAADEAVLVDPSWVATSGMSSGRANHAAVRLNNGKVLSAGGYNGSTATNTADVYDPAAGSWTPTGLMASGRVRYALAPLGNGKALAAGGWNFTTQLSTAELYDPATNLWSNAPSMIATRSGPSATVLQSGRVLVAGGLTASSTYEATAELYDPVTNTWSSGGTFTTGRRFHAAVLLSDGRVLVAGGHNTGYLASAAIYNPATNTWSTAASMSTIRSGYNANLPAVLLPNGNALVVGGYSGSSYLSTAEQYNPTTNTWSAAGTMATARVDATATLLADGKVLVTGGGGDSAVATSQQYDPTTNTWSTVTSMVTARMAHTATLLGNGKVLATGGTSTTGMANALASAELYTGTLPLGSACVAAGECASGFCADGVCCNTACNAGGCDACSVAAGATTNGTCALFTGNTCNDNNACTSGDVCQNGVCAGTNSVTCPAAGQCQQPSTCNPSTGVCSNIPKPNGTACNDGNACTTGDTCQAGACTSGAPVTCAAIDQCHNAGTCDPVAGCSNPAKVDGTSCNDGNACTTGDVCVAGSCVAGTTVTCPVADQCHQPSTCNPATGVCSNVPKPNGTACSDGNACTTGDTCQAGACTSGAPVTCAAIDQCHTAGTCDPVTGCTNPAKADGTPCNDGSLCTQNDVCVAGTCTAGTTVTCPAPTDACHGPGVCNPATGACSNPVLPDGTTCSDGNGCTQNDTCKAGLCTAGAPVVCAPIDQCHTAGTCDPSTGMCSSPAKADGTPCNDNNLCTQTDTCQAGACTGANPVTCPGPTDSCHDAGVCDPSTGACNNPAKADGATCDDGNACTQNDTCQAGACTAGTPLECAAPDACHDPGACNPVNGVCSYPAKADGTSCDDGDACTSGDSCMAGTCKGQDTVKCPEPDECHDQGVCDPISGNCSNPAKPNGTACANGVCTAGKCEQGSDPDAGTGTGGGGGAGGKDAGTGGTGVSAEGGCGCRTTPAENTSPLWIGLAALLAVRRRSSRTPRMQAQHR